MSEKAGAPRDPSVVAAHSRAPLARDVVLVGAALLPPAAWALGLLLDYGLVYPAAHAGSKVSLWAVSAITGVLALAALPIALSAGKRDASAEHGPAETIRVRVLVTAACVLSAFFFVAIVAQAIPVFCLELPK